MNANNNLPLEFCSLWFSKTDGLHNHLYETLTLSYLPHPLINNLEIFLLNISNTKADLEYKI